MGRFPDDENKPRVRVKDLYSQVGLERVNQLLQNRFFLALEALSRLTNLLNTYESNSANNELVLQLQELSRQIYSEVKESLCYVLMAQGFTSDEISASGMVQNVDQERLAQLLQNNYFLALEALSESANLLANLELNQSGDEIIQKLQKLNRRIYPESKRGIYYVLDAQRFTINEISAASMVHNGTLVLESK